MLSFGMKAKYSFEGEPRRLNKRWSQTVFRTVGKEEAGGFHAVDGFLIKISVLRAHLHTFQDDDM